MRRDVPHVPREVVSRDTGGLAPLPVIPKHTMDGFRLYPKPRNPHGRKDVDALLKHMGIRDRAH